MFLPQDLPLCGLMEQACLAEILTRNHSCQVKCAGLYADVWYAEGRDKIKDYIRVGDAELLEMLKDGKYICICILYYIYLHI